VVVPVAVEGSEHVLAVVRAIPAEPRAAVAVHLLNRRYDADHDTMIPQQDITLRLRRDLLGDRKFTKAVLHAADAEPLPLEIRCDDESTTVSVPRLTLWAIIQML